MPNDDDLRKLMVENTENELNELEKGIVLASMEIDKMQSMPTADLTVSAQIRLRRTQLEEEWVLCKQRLESLRGGHLPSADKARQSLQKARHSLVEANQRADNLATKQKEATGEIYETEDD